MLHILLFPYILTSFGGILHVFVMILFDKETVDTPSNPTPKNHNSAPLNGSIARNPPTPNMLNIPIAHEEQLGARKLTMIPEELIPRVPFTWRQIGRANV